MINSKGCSKSFYNDASKMRKKIFSLVSYFVIFIMKNATLLDHLIHSGDLLLPVSVRRRAKCVVRPTFTSSQELLGRSLPNFICSNCRVRRQKKNVNFIKCVFYNCILNAIHCWTCFMNFKANFRLILLRSSVPMENISIIVLVKVILLLLFFSSRRFLKF